MDSVEHTRTLTHTYPYPLHTQSTHIKRKCTIEESVNVAQFRLTARKMNAFDGIQFRQELCVCVCMCACLAGMEPVTIYYIIVN